MSYFFFKPWTLLCIQTVNSNTIKRWCYWCIYILFIYYIINVVNNGGKINLRFPNLTGKKHLVPIALIKYVKDNAFKI